MLSNILYILLAIVMLGIIVTVHEFGHYVVGRLCGIGIVEFSVGFGPRLLGWERKGILYSLRAIPLGGFCAFVGEDEKNDDPHAMNNQPVWKRFLTVLAGPAMNFVLAFAVCLAMLAGYYQVVEDTLPVVGQVIEGMPAAEAGLMSGDRILAVDGTEIPDGDAGVELSGQLIRGGDAGAPVAIRVRRGDEELEFEISPALAQDAQTGETIRQIGIYYSYSERRLTFPEALRETPGYMLNVVRTMLDSLRRLIFRGEGIQDTVGTVGIIAVVSQQAREGFQNVLWLMFIISLNLGIMNLLPIPALDGGRILFLIVEAIRRKPIPPEKEGLVHGIGMVLLLGLFVVLTFHDIVRLVSGGFNL